MSQAVFHRPGINCCPQFAAYRLWRVWIERKDELQLLDRTRDFMTDRPQKFDAIEPCRKVVICVTRV